MILSIVSFIFCLALSIAAVILLIFAASCSAIYLEDYLITKGCRTNFSFNIALITVCTLMFIGVLATINYFDATAESEYMNKPIKLEKVYVDKNKK